MLIEAGQYVEPLDELLGIQPNIEARALLGTTSPEYVSLQIIVNLVRNQPLLEEALVSCHFMPQRRLAQKPRFDLCRIIGILPAQGVESSCDRVAPIVEDGADCARNGFSEDRANLLFIERAQPLDYKTHDQQDFDAIGKSTGQGPNDPEPTIEKVGDAETHRKGQSGLAGPAVAFASLAPRSFPDGVGDVEHHLHRSRRRDPVAQHFEDKDALLIAESDEGNCQTVSFAQVLLADLAGIFRCDPGFIGRDYLRDGWRRECMCLRDLARRLASFAVGQRQDAVAERLVFG